MRSVERICCTQCFEEKRISLVFCSTLGTTSCRQLHEFYVEKTQTNLVSTPSLPLWWLQGSKDWQGKWGNLGNWNPEHEFKCRPWWGGLQTFGTQNTLPDLSALGNHRNVAHLWLYRLTNLCLLYNQMNSWGGGFTWALPSQTGPINGILVTENPRTLWQHQTFAELWTCWWKETHCHKEKGDS